jgi:hypothetical protein
MEIKQNTIEANITPTFFVLVRKYRFDQIRQESYWATINKLCKQCKTKEQAEAYIDRIKKDE